MFTSTTVLIRERRSWWPAILFSQCSAREICSAAAWNVGVREQRNSGQGRRGDPAAPSQSVKQRRCEHSHHGKALPLLAPSDLPEYSQQPLSRNQRWQREKEGAAWHCPGRCSAERQQRPAGVMFECRYAAVKAYSIPGHGVARRSCGELPLDCYVLHCMRRACPVCNAMQAGGPGFPKGPSFRHKTVD